MIAFHPTICRLTQAVEQNLARKHSRMYIGTVSQVRSLIELSPQPHSHSVSSVSDQNSLYQTQQSPEMVGSQSSADGVRVVHSRPKPQCWEHGCNGRRFSTFSNLLRHQREKSGQAAKSTCPNCGAEFTRTTARNGHMAHEKCKQRKSS